MANVKVKNSATGQVLEIPSDQVPFMSSQWSVVQSNAPDAPPPLASPPPTPPTSSDDVAAARAKRAADEAAEAERRRQAKQKLISDVEGAAGGLSANKEYVNAAFQAYHGRDATAEELRQFTNSRVDSVRNAVRQGAVSAGVYGTQSSGGTSGNQSAPPPSSSAKSMEENLLTPSKELVDSGLLDGMDDSQKLPVIVNANAAAIGTEEAKRLAAEYLAKAKSLADPYYKSMVNVALDELNRTVTSSAADLAYKKNEIDTKISELESDLKYNREQLTLEEQAEMAQQLRNYQSNREAVDLQMQEAGLAFSSPRKLAEQRLLTESDEVGQSIRRKFASAQRQQELTALRQQAQLQREQALGVRQSAEGVTEAMRATEAKVGSALMPATVAGQTAQTLGGVSGTIDDSRKAAIIGLEEIVRKRQGETPDFGNL
jgi:hypothetical protein